MPFVPSTGHSDSPLSAREPTALRDSFSIRVRALIGTHYPQGAGLGALPWRRGVIPGAMSDFVGRALRILFIELNLNAAEGRIRDPAVGIVGDQVLRSQLVADFLESVVELRDALCVVVFSAGVFGELNQSVFAAEVAACVRCHWNDDDAIDDGFGFLGAAQCVLVAGGARCVAAVGDQDDDLASLAIEHGLCPQRDGVIECGTRARGYPIDST